MTEEQQEWTFAVSAPARLSLSNIRGSVEVGPGEEGIIVITASIQANSGDADRTEIHVEQAQDGAVTVETRFDNGNGWLFVRSRPCKVEYRVLLPRACALKVSCVSSSISLQGLKGAFDLKTVSGDVTLKDLSGRIRAHSVSGGISGQGIAGSTEVETVSGQARLSAAQLSTVEATTVSADAEFHTPLLEGPYRLKTVSGTMRLIVPPETGCTIHSSSISGRLETSLPITGSTQKGRARGHYELQGGGPTIRFSSVSGDLWVTPSEEVPAVAFSGQPAHRAQHELIDRIARGELSALEGLSALRELRRPTTGQPQ